MPRPRTIDMTFQPDFVALNQRLRAMIVGARGGTGIVNHPPGQG
jgi:NitT/TauT family transport system ATP-binding protein